MLTVTAFAKEKLKSRLLRLKADSETTIRLIPSSKKPGNWKMIWDIEKPEDQVVESEDGIKILLIGKGLVRAVEGMVVDFRTTSEGTGFAIYRLRSNASCTQDSPT
jgi:Fe-S cluster assembly iron-binding protein IscA